MDQFFLEKNECEFHFRNSVMLYIQTEEFIMQTAGKSDEKESA